MVTKKANQVDVVPTTPEEVIAELTSRGYDTQASLSYVKAARSWSLKDSGEWHVWKAAEALLSVSASSR